MMKTMKLSVINDALFMMAGWFLLGMVLMVNTFTKDESVE